jgi:hypothetical protein
VSVIKRWIWQPIPALAQAEDLESDDTATELESEDEADDEADSNEEAFDGVEQMMVEARRRIEDL